MSDNIHKLQKQHPKKRKISSEKNSSSSEELIEDKNNATYNYEEIWELQYEIVKTIQRFLSWIEVEFNVPPKSIEIVFAKESLSGISRILLYK